MKKLRRTLQNILLKCNFNKSLKIFHVLCKEIMNSYGQLGLNPCCAKDHCLILPTGVDWYNFRSLTSVKGKNVFAMRMKAQGNEN